MMKNVKMVWSEYVGMIPSGFYRKYSRSDEVVLGTEHFTWSDDEVMYVSDDVDGSGYFYEDTLKPFIRHSTGVRVDFIFD